ncbi:hypothetical protein NONO_c36630 [Nocardia nova SH22a]|uniref:Mce-associated membrane protein n=1 Tax=Nocardia nova SH22a TaxID=1415166 RepID=W5TGI5_9NOCA|nr:hypothetical protein [Nocardia nova]AHH18450.1 hypothetical protein NONO_c36630 [Nocardia nova SH22a]
MSSTDTTTHNDTEGADAAETPDAKATDGPEHTETATARRSPARDVRSRRAVSMPLSTVVAGAVAVLALVAAATLGGFLVAARGDLAQRDQHAADDRHAEQAATNYAVGAATIRFDDLGAWIGRLKQGTSPQLSNKFDATAPKLQDILTPLKWTSTASPITAKVSSSAGGLYKVDVFVNVSSTNAQNPDGAQTTVTYNVTLDKNSGWTITDVGGVNAALPTK